MSNNFIEKSYNENSVRIVQSVARRWLSNRAFRIKILEYVDDIINYPAEEIIMKPATEVYKATQYLLFIWDNDNDHKRFEKLCRHLIQSLDSNSKSLSYIGLAISKEHTIAWVAQVKAVLRKCCDLLDNLKPEFQSDMRTILVYLHTLISFTGTKTWHLLNANKLDLVRTGMNIICSNIVDHLVQNGLYKTLQSLLSRGLGRPKLYLKSVALSAISRLSLLPLQLVQFSDKILTMYLIHILSVPGLLLHFQRLSPECIQLLVKNSILQRSINLLYVEQNLKIVFNALEGRYALCLLANILHLCHIERDTTFNDLYYPSITYVATWLLENCQHYVVTKQSNMTYWHPILGWFAQKLDSSLQEAMPHVKAQLYMLWSPALINVFLVQPLKLLLKDIEPVPVNVPSSTAGNFLKKITEHRTVKSATTGPNHCFKLGGNESIRIARLCSLYQTALSTMSQLRLDILTGICYHEEILYNLWQFFGALGPNFGLKSFLDLLAVNTKSNAPEFLMLHLFCDCMTHYITILDDVEMYQDQKPFTLQDFIALSAFLNQFLYKAITQNLFDLRTLNSNYFFQSMHTLLLVLYRRDCRRNFTPNQHWLIKEIRVASFISDLEKGKKPIQTLLQKMPHVLAQSERVRMFRRHVANEKAVCGLTESACGGSGSASSGGGGGGGGGGVGSGGGSQQCTVVVTVRRNRIIEDGYRQLALLPPQALKGLVRVRFVNELGLDEAGVDQDGVFKEFLEETIKKVFDPSLNLFRVTSEQRLYPSPTSHLQDHHLQLFEFVGRMLGKAVYEGIVVDVPFASFFLSQLLGQPHQALYSSIDELPSLDPELYQSLTYIKHSKGDVKDLDLTFSVDEDVMGRIVTHELLPGGKVIPVTNDNKINYIHMMAHFRMHTQIKHQSAAFIRGFRSIINPEWLLLFSAPELQHLISGDNAPLDMKALRRHTQYYGGFHDSHRVVVWLWDILEKDFNDEEKRLFLKFVTSCSKPPLLGFAHLEPPFSIRCVEVGDDEDTGDTIGSVIRGFFTIRKKDPHLRLPTSSTCFNLLKLPNYQKKSTLREKLKYAVTSNTGFELS